MPKNRINEFLIFIIGNDVSTWSYNTERKLLLRTSISTDIILIIIVEVFGSLIIKVVRIAIEVVSEICFLRGIKNLIGFCVSITISFDHFIENISDILWGLLIGFFSDEIIQIISTGKTIFWRFSVTRFFYWILVVWFFWRIWLLLLLTMKLLCPYSFCLSQGLWFRFIIDVGLINFIYVQPSISRIFIMMRLYLLV